MSDITGRQQLILDQDLIVDKVVFRASPTYSVPQATTIGDYSEYTIPHGLPFTPLILGTYSDDNFATSYDFGVGPYGTLTAFGFDGYVMLAHAWSDATNVYVRIQSHNTPRGITCHIIGLAPGISPDGIGSLGIANIPVPEVQDNFLFTTDTNYLKHYTWGSISVTTNGLDTYVNRTFSTVMSTPLTMLCFLKEDGKVSYMNTMNTINGGAVNLSCLTKPYFFTVGVKSNFVKTVDVITKLYIDA